MDPLTYRQAGVDIEAGDEAVRRIARVREIGEVVPGTRSVELV